MGVTEMGVTLVFSEMSVAAKGYAGRWVTGGRDRNGCDTCIFQDGCSCYGSITGDSVGGYGKTPVEEFGVDLAASWKALEVEDICSNRFLLDATLACSLACTNQNRIYYTSVNRIIHIDRQC